MKEFTEDEIFFIEVMLDDLAERFELDEAWILKQKELFGLKEEEEQ